MFKKIKSVTLEINHVEMNWLYCQTHIMWWETGPGCQPPSPIKKNPETVILEITNRLNQI